MARSSISSTMGPPPGFDGTRQRSASGFTAAGVLGQGNPMSLVQPAGATGLQGNGSNNSGSGGNANQCKWCFLSKFRLPSPLLGAGDPASFLSPLRYSLVATTGCNSRVAYAGEMGPRTNNRAVAGFSDAWLTAQNFNDMNSYNPNYMIAPHVTHEFNLLNDFLHSGLLDDSGLAADETQQSAAFNRTGQSDMLPGGFGGRTALPAGGSGSGPNLQGGSMPPPPSVDGKGAARTANSASDKTREYYLQAADPSGNDNAEQRMTRVLKAKYEAGLLRPFNYINGYARLGKYLDGHIAASSKQKILRTINQFRPKFREKAQGLTDMQLVYVEMWFEMQLMDYDRVFASMAVPACCWRRTGEIFRGNKEMAELINVPVDQLRDVSLNTCYSRGACADVFARARLRCTRFSPRSPWCATGRSSGRLRSTRRTRRC